MEYYHAITQSDDGKNIFPNTADCLVYLQLIKEACLQYNVKWLAYAVMPTHTHMVFAVEKGAKEQLTKARRKITCGYTAYIRRTYPALCAAEGERVFKRRNTAKILQTPRDVKQAIRYLHLNPIEKELEKAVGQTIRSSYQAVLTIWEPENLKNPFNQFMEFQEIRDALALDVVCRLFDRNRNAQMQSFLSYHKEKQPEVLAASPTTQVLTVEKMQVAENILKHHFLRLHSFQGKPFDAHNRQAFLQWVNRRGNKAKIFLVLQLSKDALLSVSEIAIFLNTSDTTVRRILKENNPSEKCK